MGTSGSTHGRDEKSVQNRSENLKGKDNLEVLGVDRRIILECISGK